MTFYPSYWSYTMEYEPRLGTQLTTAEFLDPENGDLRLKTESPLFTAGTSIPGVSDGTYIGAFAPDSEPLDTGHDFSKQYQEYYTFPNVIYMNRIRNAAFGYGDLRYWETEGEQISIKQESSWNNPDAMTRAGNYSVRFGSGKNIIRQTIKGLSKNTTYVLSGWAITDGNSDVTMGIEGKSASITFTDQAWTRKFITFHTGNNTEITVYYQSSGNGVSYCGDMGLAQPTLISEKDFQQISSETMQEDMEPLLQSDRVAYGIPTIEKVNFLQNTASVTLSNMSNKTVSGEIHVLSYRIKNDAKELIGFRRYPITLSGGTVNNPFQTTISVPVTRETSAGNYCISVRVTEGSLFLPIGTVFRDYYSN